MERSEKLNKKGCRWNVNIGKSVIYMTKIV
jgi:hypothetical protein